MWINILIGALLIFVGMAVHLFKWYFLISGYNTMSKEKKAKVDTKGLARLLGMFSYINGSVFILTGILQLLKVDISTTLAYVFLTASTVILLIKAQKYDGNIFDKEGKLVEGAGKKLILPLTVVGITVVAIVLLLVFSSRDTQISIDDEGIEIHGMYGDTYAWTSIQSVELLEEMPLVLTRTNGSALGSKLKGHFKTKPYGSVKLFVDAEKPPYILMLTLDQPVIFNLKNQDETVKAYENLKLKIRE
ncbi:conserved membrane protein of unknown function [Petrocella atlantisensis]|uniref:DUF3784 domain-containing protein n=1 Tax=Petrocella atlantisensis TaxID=2173034 RepID=A0A3P7PA42_9FIRM|nr:DUF3784 domain-containing protein [Petrocella atlantisensis]MCF8019401.1 DUF3784 domain-containing protein [Vallitaleaceae bacterium]VDN47023.1 conserved membrane protein of unknown function [Petrocella atlantisensis]